MLNLLFKKQAQVLQAMAHPRRLEIINLLRDQTLSVSQIQAMLALRQAYLSQHLTVLRESGILKLQKKGKEHYYEVVRFEYLTAIDAIRQALGEEEDILTLVPLALDPVCGMRVSSKTAGARVNFNHKDYYFCATGCAKKFTRKPELYVQN